MDHNRGSGKVRLGVPLPTNWYLGLIFIHDGVGVAHEAGQVEVSVAVKVKLAVPRVSLEELLKLDKGASRNTIQEAAQFGVLGHQSLVAGIVVPTVALKTVPVDQSLYFRIPTEALGSDLIVTMVFITSGTSFPLLHKVDPTTEKPHLRFVAVGGRNSVLVTFKKIILSVNGLPADTWAVSLAAKGGLCAGYTSKVTVAFCDEAPSESTTKYVNDV